MSQGPSLVLDWLSKLYLSQYVESFIDNGYDDLEVCKLIGELDLDAIGVRIQYHRHQLLTAVRRLNQDGKRKSPPFYFTLEPANGEMRPKHAHAHMNKDETCPQRAHMDKEHLRSQTLALMDCNDFVMYPKLRLKVLIRNKLAKDGINLQEAPYTQEVRIGLWESLNWPISVFRPYHAFI
uniref:SAM domain-containing protein n=1 Tax=Periophthalmus magnuspinnatus TaxID=409849 RepID=A0A3B4BBV5_9GOBI